MLAQIEREEKQEAFVEKQRQEKEAELAKEMAEPLEFNTTKRFNRLQLLSLLKNKVKELIKEPSEKVAESEDQSEESKASARRLVVGTVGYPNVGKSSVINVLCGRKRVGVAALPGKTKHFQTLNINDDL